MCVRHLSIYFDVASKLMACGLGMRTSGSQVTPTVSTIHDDVIKWKHFPRYWPLVRGIHRSPVNSPHKGQWRGALRFSLICAWIKRLSKQWRGWWFETLSCPLWRHRDDFLSNGDIWVRFNVLTTTTENPTHAATNNWIVSFVNVKFKWLRRRPPLNNMYLESYSGVLRAVV